MRLHALTLSFAHLTDPPVLEQRQRREQDEQCSGEDSQRGGPPDLHEPECNTQNSRKILEIKLLHS
jgi:hypothetical protein